MVRPSDCVIAWAWAIMDLHRARRPGSEVTPSRVARVRALIGLKQTLPQSLSQMFRRIVSRIGASNPAETRHRAGPRCGPRGVAHCLSDGRLRIVLGAYPPPPTPLTILTLRNLLLLPKVRAFVDFLQQHWMHPRPLSDLVRRP